MLTYELSSRSRGTEAQDKNAPHKTGHTAVPSGIRVLQRGGRFQLAASLRSVTRPPPFGRGRAPPAFLSTFCNAAGTFGVPKSIGTPTPRYPATPALVPASSRVPAYLRNRGFVASTLACRLC
eukprot:3231570-Rhodomonas_salina.3